MAKFVLACELATEVENLMEIKVRHAFSIINVSFLSVDLL